MSTKRDQMKNITPWQNLSGAKDLPLYERLAEQIRSSIREGVFREGQRLPSKRSLSESLGVSLTTVGSAYDTLVAEGYLVSFPRSGFEISPLADLYLRLPPVKEYSPRQDHQQATKQMWRLDLDPHGIDKSLYPEKTVKRIYRKIIDAGALSDETHRRGLLILREELAADLKSSQDIEVSASDIVISYGMQGLYRFLFELLSPDMIFGIEDPGYPTLEHTLRRSARKYRFLPLSEEGIHVGDLEQKNVQIASLTPAHQFPTGLEYSSHLRMELLHWAYEKPGRYLIEDAYDSAFCYQPSVESLRKLDPSGERVLYIGSFSRSWSPGLRISYLCLTPDLSRKASDLGIPHANPVPIMEQRFLAELIRSGTYERHLNRARRLYHKKRRQLIAAFDSSSLPWEVRAGTSGLHFTVRLPEETDAGEFVRYLRTQHIRLQSVYQYCFENHWPQELLIGFGALPEENIPSAVHMLEASWEKYINQ